MPARGDRPLSPGSAGAYFLCWQEPTDRALTGWNPYGMIIESMGREKLEPWLTEELTMTKEEFDAWQQREYRSQVLMSEG